MPGLGETLNGLARRRTNHSYRDARLRRTVGFGHNPGALEMLSYVPEHGPAGAPLVVLLHGCTQDAELHAAAAGWLGLADRLGFAVLAPQQVASNNANRCFNWFEPGDTTRGEGEAASIQAMVVHMVAKHGLDAERVFVSGLSAGGAMAAAMLATYPETFAGGAIVAGLPYGAAGSVQEALGAMRGRSRLSRRELVDRVTRAAPQPSRRPRVCIWHGEGDHTVNPALADDLALQWSGVHGLGPAPDTREALPGRTRARWLSASGEVMVEQHRLQGFGHGVPLATRGDQGIGYCAPFMLEAGVASALSTARFWGLAPDLADEERANPSTPPQEEAASGLGARVLAATSPHVPAAAQDVIARALGAAGLLR